MELPGPLRRPRPVLLSTMLLALGLCAPAVADADTLTLSTATKAGSVYPWCGGKTLVQALQPDAAPPATPTSCRDYSPSGASGTLTAQFGAHQAGIVTASVYVHDDSRPLTALLYVDGVRAGATITAPQVRSGWLTFPSASVSASAAISVQIRAGSTGSGYARVYTVHADLTSPTTSLGQPGNWATTPLPWAVALAGGAAPNGVALTTAVPRELAGEAAADSWVNSTAYTAGIFYVPVNTALQPVRLCRFSAQCIPNWGSPAYDQWGARRTGFIVQTSGTPVSTVDPLDTLSGAYVRPTDSSWYGPDVANPGAANSTTFDSAWGVTAARTPLVADVVSQSDCQAVLNGAADFGHAIGIQLQATRNPITAGGSPWWPAGSSDGTAPGMATTEGMRVFFEPSVAMPSGLSPAAQALFHTLERYGAVVDDTTGGGPVVSNAADGSYQSGGALMLRSQLDSTATGPCATLGISSALSGIPWGKVSGPIAMGSDANANPT